MICMEKGVKSIRTIRVKVCIHEEKQGQRNAITDIETIPEEFSMEFQKLELGVRVYNPNRSKDKQYDLSVEVVKRKIRRCQKKIMDHDVSSSERKFIRPGE